MSAILGADGKLYRQTTGTRAAWPGTGAPANLDLIGNVRDLDLKQEMADADVTTRANSGFRASMGTLIDAELTFEMVADTDDTDFTAIQTAFFAKTNIAMAVLNGLSTVAGTQGLWADWRVTGFSRSENLEDAMKHKVTMKPGYSAVPPAWITVAA